MSSLQERTGKIKWMRELRERDWGEYVRGLCKQIMRKDQVRVRLETYHAWVVCMDDELRMFCDYAKKQFNLKHEGEGLRLVWRHEHCEKKTCGTCLGTYNTHYPYPELENPTHPRERLDGKFVYLKTKKKGKISVRRGELKEFLMGECGFTSGQADAFFQLIDLRHLMIRRFNYEVMELKNLGVV